MICESPILRGPHKGQPATGTNAGYVRHQRAGEPACDDCVAGKTKFERIRESRGESAWFLRDQLLDWLDVDGGWLTSAGIATDLGRSVGAVERVLRELRDDELAESRVVELAHTSGGSGYQTRTEWRTV